LVELNEIFELAEAPCHTRVVDQRDTAAIGAFLREVIAAEGKIDVVVNNTGTLIGSEAGVWEELSPDEWRGYWAETMDSAFYFSQTVATQMKTQRTGGHIIFVAGGGEFLPAANLPPAYLAVRAALTAFAQRLAHELGPYRITVNCVVPGYMRASEEAEHHLRSLSVTAQNNLLRQIAMRRLGQPEDVAYPILYLASDYASWISGQVLNVDGGR
jgi:3-oxoacyl-[acyl-carrier protein] reductase